MFLGKLGSGYSHGLGVLALALAVAAAGGTGCGGATDDRPARWSFLSTAILEPTCATANCHSAIAARASVDLSDRDVGYRSLLTRQFVISAAAAPTLTADQRVARSEVPQLMRAVGSLRMPPDIPLPETDILLFEKWIAAGANND
jgi:hypothetical protein